VNGHDKHRYGVDSADARRREVCQGIHAGDKYVRVTRPVARSLPSAALHRVATTAETWQGLASLRRLARLTLSIFHH
jgi:hypothetical protein